MSAYKYNYHIRESVTLQPHISDWTAMFLILDNLKGGVGNIL